MQAPVNPYRPPQSSSQNDARQPATAPALINCTLLTASILGLILAVTVDVGSSVAMTVVPRLFLGSSFMLGWCTAVTGSGIAWLVLYKAGLLRPLPCAITGFAFTFGFAFVVKFLLNL